MDQVDHHPATGARCRRSDVRVLKEPLRRDHRSSQIRQQPKPRRQPRVRSQPRRWCLRRPSLRARLASPRLASPRPTSHRPRIRHEQPIRHGQPRPRWHPPPAHPRQPSCPREEYPSLPRLATGLRINPVGRRLIRPHLIRPHRLASVSPTPLWRRPSGSATSRRRSGSGSPIPPLQSRNASGGARSRAVKQRPARKERHLHPLPGSSRPRGRPARIPARDSQGLLDFTANPIVTPVVAAARIGMAVGSARQKTSGWSEIRRGVG